MAISTSMQKTSPTILLAEASGWPTRQINELRKTNKKESCDLTVRLLHVLQLVVTTIALPLILLSSVLEAAFRTAICQFSNAIQIIVAAPIVAVFHAGLVPASLTGALINDDLAQRLEKALTSCADCLLDCE